MIDVPSKESAGEEPEDFSYVAVMKGLTQGNMMNRRANAITFYNESHRRRVSKCVHPTQEESAHPTLPAFAGDFSDEKDPDYYVLECLGLE